GAVPAADRWLLAAEERPGDAAGDGGDVLPLPALRRAGRSLRPAILHGRGTAAGSGWAAAVPAHRRAGGLPLGSPAAAAGVLAGAVDDGGATDGGGAGGLGEGGRDRLGGEQRDRAGGGPARDGGGGSGDRLFVRGLDRQSPLGCGAGRGGTRGGGRS